MTNTKPLCFACIALRKTQWKISSAYIGIRYARLMLLASRLLHTLTRFYSCSRSLIKNQYNTVTLTPSSRRQSKSEKETVTGHESRRMRALQSTRAIVTLILMGTKQVMVKAFSHFSCTQEALSRTYRRAKYAQIDAFNSVSYCVYACAGYFGPCTHIHTCIPRVCWEQGDFHRFS
jgi:hypothetical protein